MSGTKVPLSSFKAELVVWTRQEKKTFLFNESSDGPRTVSCVMCATVQGLKTQKHRNQASSVSRLFSISVSIESSLWRSGIRCVGRSYGPVRNHLGKFNYWHEASFQVEFEDPRGSCHSFEGSERSFPSCFLPLSYYNTKKTNCGNRFRSMSESVVVVVRGLFRR